MMMVDSSPEIVCILCIYTSTRLHLLTQSKKVCCLFLFLSQKKRNKKKGKKQFPRLP